MRRLLKERNFRLLFMGQTLTMLGDSALFLVLAIWVKSLTGSDAAAGLVFLFHAIPALAAPFGGLFIDRFPRRRVLIADDIASALAVLTLLFVHDRADIWIVYAVAFLYGASQQVFFAARSGLLVGMVDETDLGDANGLLESLRQGLHIGGPLLGAGMFALWGGGSVAIFDALTFLASAGFLSFLRVPDLVRGRERPALLQEISAGGRHIWRTSELRTMVGAVFVCLATVGMINAAFFQLIDKGLHKPPEFVGIIGMVQGIGSVIGGVLAGPGTRRFGEGRLAAAGIVILGAGLGLVAVGTMPTALPGASIVGLGVAALSVAYVTLLQKRTSFELQGRVFAAAEAALAIPMTLSAAVGVALVTVFGFRFIYGLNGVVIVLVGLVLFRVTRTWRRGGEPAEIPVPTAPVAEPLFPTES